MVQKSAIFYTVSLSMTHLVYETGIFYTFSGTPAGYRIAICDRATIANRVIAPRPYLTLSERPMRSVVLVVMPFSSQILRTVVWYFTAMDDSVSPERTL